MTPDPVDALRPAWRAGAEQESGLSLLEVRRLAQRTSARFRRQNIVGYAACAVGTTWIAFVLLRFELDITATIGAVLLGLGGILMAVHSHLKGWARVPNEELGEQALLAFQQRELTRQRDFLRWGGRWYTAGLPLWPGMAALLAGAVLAGRISWPWAVAQAAVVATLAVTAVQRNHREARRLDRLLEALPRSPD
jgi:hypothetical protein